MTPPARNAHDRAAFREFVRTHHPDVGGDPAVFTAALARMRGRTTGNRGARDSSVRFVRSPPRLPERLANWWSRRNRHRVR